MLARGGGEQLNNRASKQTMFKRNLLNYDIYIYIYYQKSHVHLLS